MNLADEGKLFIDELFEKTGCGGMVTLEHVEIIQYTSGT